MRFLSGLFGCVLPVVVALSLGCGTPEKPKGEFPDAFEPMEGENTAPEPTYDAPPEPASEPAPGALKGSRPAADDSIPDDYSMMAGDCRELGKQLAALTRSDNAALLSPKLKEAQRTQAMKNIDTVATKLGNKWSETCESTLVGKTVDRRALKCAMDAKTVKDFDACLNAQEPPQQ